MQRERCLHKEISVCHMITKIQKLSVSFIIWSVSCSEWLIVQKAQHKAHTQKLTSSFICQERQQIKSISLIKSEQFQKVCNIMIQIFNTRISLSYKHNILSVQISAQVLHHLTIITKSRITFQQLHICEVTKCSIMSASTRRLCCDWMSQCFEKSIVQSIAGRQTWHDMTIVILWSINRDIVWSCYMWFFFFLNENPVINLTIIVIEDKWQVTYLECSFPWFVPEYFFHWTPSDFFPQLLSSHQSLSEQSRTSFSSSESPQRVSHHFLWSDLLR